MAELGDRARAYSSFTTSTMSQPQSPLFCLPREIRDQVYEHAFGDEPTRLFYDPLMVLIINIFPSEEVAYPEEDVAKGLPTWILGSKQLCSEALCVLGKSRYFSPIDDLQFQHSIHNDHSRGILNPLAINLKVINHVGFLEIYSCEVKEMHEYFLQLLRKFRAADLASGSSPNLLSFKTIWRTYGKKDGGFYLPGWAYAWPDLVLPGECPKVKLTISHYGNEDTIGTATENLGQFTKGAADCAAGLVANGAQPIWGEWTLCTIGDGLQVFEKTLVAEQKV